MRCIVGVLRRSCRVLARTFSVRNSVPAKKANGPMPWSRCVNTALGARAPDNGPRSNHRGPRVRLRQAAPSCSQRTSGVLGARQTAGFPAGMRAPARARKRTRSSSAVRARRQRNKAHGVVELAHATEARQGAREQRRASCTAQCRAVLAPTSGERSRGNPIHGPPRRGSNPGANSARASAQCLGRWRAWQPAVAVAAAPGRSSRPSGSTSSRRGCCPNCGAWNNRRGSPGRRGRARAVGWPRAALRASDGGALVRGFCLYAMSPSRSRVCAWRALPRSWRRARRRARRVHGPERGAARGQRRRAVHLRAQLARACVAHRRGAARRPWQWAPCCWATRALRPRSRTSRRGRRANLVARTLALVANRNVAVVLRGTWMRLRGLEEHPETLGELMGLPVHAPGTEADEADAVASCRAMATQRLRLRGGRSSSSPSAAKSCLPSISLMTVLCFFSTIRTTRCVHNSWKRQPAVWSHAVASIVLVVDEVPGFFFTQSATTCLVTTSASLPYAASSFAAAGAGSASSMGSQPRTMGRRRARRRPSSWYGGMMSSFSKPSGVADSMSAGTARAQLELVASGPRRTASTFSTPCSAVPVLKSKGRCPFARLERERALERGCAK